MEISTRRQEAIGLYPDWGSIGLCKKGNQCIPLKRRSLHLSQVFLEMIECVLAVFSSRLGANMLYSTLATLGNLFREVVLVQHNI